MSTVDDVSPEIERKLQSMGLELYELKYHRAGRHSVLKVFIDKPEGVTVDDCEQASRELSVLLDVEEFSNGPYSLEVSSPGIDRPLRSPQDFQRVRGRDVTVELTQPVGSRSRRLSGTVQSCTESTLVLACDGETIEVPLDTVKSSKIEVRFK